jgi:hypothetical protein
LNEKAQEKEKEIEIERGDAIDMMNPCPIDVYQCIGIHLFKVGKN